MKNKTVFHIDVMTACKAIMPAFVRNVLQKEIIKDTTIFVN